MGLSRVSLISALLMIIFALSLTGLPVHIGIPVHRNTPNDPLNDLLQELEETEPENTEVRKGVPPNSQEHSRHSRDTEDLSQSKASSGVPAAKTHRTKQSSGRHPSKSSIAQASFAREKKKGSNPDPDTPNAEPTQLDAPQSKDEAQRENAGGSGSLPSDASTSNSNATSTVPNLSGSSNSSDHKPSNTGDGHGPSVGLFASEGALYRAFYVVMALIMLVLLYFFIKFAIIRYRSSRSNPNRRPAYGRLGGGRHGGSSETQRLGAPDDEDEDDAAEEDEVDRYIASIRRGQTDEMAEHVVFQQRPPNVAKSSGLTMRVNGPTSNGSAARLGANTNTNANGNGNGSSLNMNGSAPSAAAAGAATRRTAGGPSPLS